MQTGDISRDNHGNVQRGSLYIAQIPPGFLGFIISHIVDLLHAWRNQLACVCILTDKVIHVVVKVAGNHVNEIHDFCKQLNFSRLGCLCRRHFALRFACLPIDIEHGKF